MQQNECGLAPLSDQVLVRVLPLETTHGSLVIPETADHGRMPIRRGVVVAIGCGDLVAPKCPKCEGTGKRNNHKCGSCHGAGYLPHERTSFSVKVNDEVLYHPRGWAHYDRDGTEYIVLHEDQGILAVLDETIRFHPVARRETRGGSFEGGTVSSHQ